MSIDSTRKQTKGWEINSSGKMVNLAAGDGIVIDEAAPIAESAAMPITDSAFVRTEPPPVPNDPGRGRPSTLDSFNEEMAVLDRPLEGAVDVDEAPPPARWRRVGIFAVVVAVMGVGGGVVLSRRHAAVESRAQTSQPATSPGAAVPSVIAATATTEAPAVGAPASATAANEGSVTEEEAAAAAPSHAAADKAKAKSGHSKHSRSTSSKSSHRHSTKRSVSSKHSSSRRH